jgi:hypothetical protein
MASAIRYALNSWQELTRFLDDAQIPPDNNRVTVRPPASYGGRGDHAVSRA